MTTEVLAAGPGQRRELRVGPGPRAPGDGCARVFHHLRRDRRRGIAPLPPDIRQYARNLLVAERLTERGHQAGGPFLAVHQDTYGYRWRAGDESRSDESRGDQLLASAVFLVTRQADARVDRLPGGKALLFFSSERRERGRRAGFARPLDAREQCGRTRAEIATRACQRTQLTRLTIQSQKIPAASAPAASAAPRRARSRIVSGSRASSGASLTSKRGCTTGAGPAARRRGIAATPRRRTAAAAASRRRAG